MAYRHQEGHDTWHFCSDSHTAAHDELVSIARRVSLSGCARYRVMDRQPSPSAKLFSTPPLPRSFSVGREQCRRTKVRVPQRRHSGPARAATLPGRRWCQSSRWCCCTSLAPAAGSSGLSCRRTCAICGDSTRPSRPCTPATRRPRPTMRSPACAQAVAHRNRCSR
jgi:hypothetical protein